MIEFLKAHRRAVALAASVVAMWSTLLVVFGPTLAERRVLHEASGTTTAVVVRHEPDSRNRATYEYLVDGRRYTGSLSDPSLRVGDTLVIHYALQAPRLSSAWEPQAAYRDAVAGLIALCAFFGIGAPLVATVRGPAGAAGFAFLIVTAVALLNAPGSVTVGVASALVVSAAGAALLLWIYRRTRKRPNPLSLR